MKQSEAERLANNLSLRYGLEWAAQTRSDANGQFVELTPAGIPASEGYAIQIRTGWRSLSLRLNFGRYAGDLVEHMGAAGLQGRTIFASIARQMTKDKGMINFTVNSINYDAGLPDSWPSHWKDFAFSVRKSPVDVNTDDHALHEFLIGQWAGRFAGCVLALSPLDHQEWPEDAGVQGDDVAGLPEGAKTRVEVNRYERSRYNRAVCISFHGCRCQVCEIDFAGRYGSIGEGFIHVHHVVPVSRVGAEYIIDPIKDLVPVCPNCHSMMHRRDPPLSVSELRQMLRGSASAV